MSSNPLLESLRLPGRIFQLPSRGLFYTDGELVGTSNAEIHVHPMSALDEIVIKNPDQLFSGEGISTVFTHCADGIAKPKELLSKDVDAMMLFLRLVTYGPNYEFFAKHTCENAKEHSYIANLEQIHGRMKYLDPTVIESAYTITLQNNQVVKLCPYRYSKLIEIMKDNENKTDFTAADQQENLLKMIMNVIKSVDGIEDPNLIIEWIRAVPATYIARIAEKVENINDWGVDMGWEVTCADCGEKFTVELPINPVDFFTE